MSRVHDSDLEWPSTEKHEPPSEENMESRRSSATLDHPDPNLVTWDGPDDRSNPRNWQPRQKWTNVLIVSLFTLISSVSTSIIAPALPSIAAELQVPGAVEQSVILSITVLAFAIGPLFLGPLSEIYGRVRVIQLSNLFFLWNLGGGLARTKGELIAFGFLAGFGGSAPLSIGGGVLSDLFQPEQRGRALSMYSLALLLGPAMGRLMGGFITLRTTWRWCFYAISIASVAIQLPALFLLKETFPPLLLSRKCEALRKETGDDTLHTRYQEGNKDNTGSSSILNAMLASFQRPFRMLATQVIVQVLALYIMYLYGLMYLVLMAFPNLWRDSYHENAGIGGLNYIALGVGFFLGAQIGAPLQDRIYERLKQSRSGGSAIGRPEFRVPFMVPGALFVPIGLLVYGWTAEYRTHWIGPDIGCTIFSAGIVMGFQCIQCYVLDTYPQYAASAIAAVAVMDLSRECY